MSFDFEEYVTDRFEIRPQTNDPDQVSIDCINPDCDDNWRHNRKMTVNLREKVAFCFKCGKSYRLVDFVAQVEGISKLQAVRIIKDQAPAIVFEDDRLTKAIEKLAPAEDDLVAAPDFKPISWPPFSIPLAGPGSDPGLCSAGLKYLRKRNFGEDIIRAFSLKFCTFGDYANRIVIPVFRDGQMVHFQARTIIEGAKPKYLFPTEGGFSNSLYNWDEAKLFSRLILVEGITDLWRCWLAGYRNVVATFGKTLKKEQRQAILNQSTIRELVLFWDADAMESIMKSAEALAPYRRILVAELPVGMEPDTCPNIPECLSWAYDPSTMSPLERALRAKRLA